MVSISFEKTTLSNGLDVILHEDHSIPLVAVNLWYHVGSKDEQVGRTGFAHLFEHIMFEGSKHHNRSHFEPLQKAGANLNGSTTSDRTNYWEDVPSNYLELALWLESDRMGFLLEALDQQRFDIQRDVVKNERRQSYENRPYGMAAWHIQEALFPLPHPYHWLTIGSQEDLDAATLEDVKAFFRRFYSPSNASLAIAGDLDKQQALELVQRYFSNLPPGPPLSRTGRFDSDLAGRVELEMRDKVLLPRLYIAWPTPPDFHADDAPLELLRAILADGLSSRLHRSLVYEKQIAQSVRIRYYSAEIAGQFVVEVTAAAGHDLKEVEDATDAELERVRRAPPTDEEIARAKNRLEADHYRALAKVGGFSGRADQLNHFNIFTGDPSLINSNINTYLSVRREDILRVADSVLNHRQVRLRVLPEQSLKPAITGIDRSVMPAPTVAPTFSPPVPLRHRLNNGLRLVVVEKPGLPMVCFGLLLPVGATSDPLGLPGLASFTAQLLAEGTETRSSQDIAAAFEFIGARLSTDAHYEYTLVSTETLSKHWPQALALLADLVQHPTFPEHELERVRREHLTSLRRIKDDPTSIAEQIMPELVFGQRSRYGHPVHGTESAVAALSRADIVRLFRQHYGPQNVTLIVVGDTTIAEVVNLAEAEFGGWKAASSPSPVSTSEGEAAGGEAKPTTIYLVDKPGAAQSVIRAGHPTIPRHHPDYLGLTVLNYTFGGQFSARLNQNLRESKGYTYGYHSWVNWHVGSSSLVAGGSVQTAVTRESVQETLREFADIHGTRPLSRDEFEGAKAGILRGYPASFERPAQVLSHLVQLVVHSLPDDYFRTFAARVEALSLAELHRISSERVMPDRLKILVVADRQATEAGLRELELPMVLLDSDGAEFAD
jgi:zinc protease